MSQFLNNNGLFEGEGGLAPQPRKRPNCCAACKSYRPEEDIEAGECRRYAPRPRVDGSNTAFWPNVLPTDWCSEFH